MTSHDTTDRETLSALFDGELQGDARRFASRRLAHDTAWQEDCGRWQLMGDAMRRQAPIAAPADFAARVERAIAAEAAVAMPVTSAVATSPRRPARLWAGGAIAASLALLAVFATRSPQAVTPPSPTVAAAASATPVPATSSTQAPAAALEQAPVVAASTEVEQATALAPEAVREPARRLVAAAPAPRVPRRSASSSVDASPAVVAPQRAASAVLAAATFTPPDATNPFHVPAADPLSGRPWPRTAISAGGALTASYGAPVESRGESPSFYPFEPRAHAEAAARAESP
jgi:Meckel syndrome type 1 protein